MNISLKLNTPCELINVIPYNPLISKCQIKVCYVGEKPNRNRSIITKETARRLLTVFPAVLLLVILMNQHRILRNIIVLLKSVVAKCILKTQRSLMVLLI